MMKVIIDFTGKLGPVPTDPDGMTMYALSYWDGISNVVFAFTGKKQLIVVVSPNKEMITKLVEVGCQIFDIVLSEEAEVGVSYDDDTIRVTVRDRGNMVIVSFATLLTEWEK